MHAPCFTQGYDCKCKLAEADKSPRLQYLCALQLNHICDCTHTLLFALACCNYQNPVHSSHACMRRASCKVMASSAHKLRRTNPPNCNLSYHCTGMLLPPQSSSFRQRTTLNFIWPTHACAVLHARLWLQVHTHQLRRTNSADCNICVHVK